MGDGRREAAGRENLAAACRQRLRARGRRVQRRRVLRGAFATESDVCFRPRPAPDDDDPWAHIRLGDEQGAAHSDWTRGRVVRVASREQASEDYREDPASLAPSAEGGGAELAGAAAGGRDEDATYECGSVR